MAERTPPRTRALGPVAVSRLNPPVLHDRRRTRRVLEPGRYVVEWFGVDGRETIEAKDVTVDVQGPVDFQSPTETEPSVVYLRSA